MSAPLSPETGNDNVGMRLEGVVGCIKTAEILACFAQHEVVKW